MAAEIRWILEGDISQCFDPLDQAHLRTLVQHRVRDGVMTRRIGKWLNAGGLEQSVWHYPEAGTPQGGAISPLLRNIYVHEVLDQWFAQEGIPRLRGRACIRRFADDAVMGFASQEDAERGLKGLPKRCGKYGRTIHPDKTRLVAFGRPKSTRGNTSGTCDF
jgi:RNA-directed DNA polymerase